MCVFEPPPPLVRMLFYVSPTNEDLLFPAHVGPSPFIPHVVPLKRLVLVRFLSLSFCAPSGADASGSMSHLDRHVDFNRQTRPEFDASRTPSTRWWRPAVGP